MFMTTCSGLLSYTAFRTACRNSAGSIALRIYSCNTLVDRGLCSMVPSGSAQQLIDVQGDITKRMNALNGNSSLSEADRTSQLAALNGEARARLSSVLGEKGFDLYKVNAGFWLNALPQSK